MGFMKIEELLSAIASPTPPLRWVPTNSGQVTPVPGTTEMYCVKCRTKRLPVNQQQVTMKNGKPAIKGVCPIDGTGMYKIGALSGQAPTFVQIEEENSTPVSLFDYLKALPKI